jgi:hypothetical protein
MKAALAPPDFNIGQFEGIPDKYDGKSLTQCYKAVVDISSLGLTDAKDTYIIQSPIPGVSFLYGQYDSGTGTIALNPYFYPGYDTQFPLNFEDRNIESFRFGGAAIEIVPTVNAMTWTGNVQCTRGVVSLETSGYSAAAGNLCAVGLSSLLYSTKPDALHPFNQGLYAVASFADEFHTFRPIQAATLFSEVAVTSYSAGALCNWNQSVPFMGIGGMETTVIKIPAWSATTNLGVVRTWASLEYRCGSASLYYDFQRPSAPYDPVALLLARKAMLELPTCMPYYKNAGFWEEVLKWLKTVSSMASFLPGPVGEVAAGVSIAATGLEALVL